MDDIFCRTCLIPQGKFEYKSIFTENGKIAQEIFNLTSLMILDLSDLRCPAVICQRCIFDLERAVSFRNLILKSEEQLKEQILHGKIEKALRKICGKNLNSYSKEHYMKTKDDSTKYDESLTHLVKLEYEQNKLVNFEGLPEKLQTNVQHSDKAESQDALNNSKSSPKKLKHFARKSMSSPIKSKKVIPDSMTLVKQEDEDQNYDEYDEQMELLEELPERLPNTQYFQQNNEEFPDFNELIDTNLEYAQEINDSQPYGSPKSLSNKSSKSDYSSLLYPTTQLFENDQIELHCNMCIKTFSKKCYLTQHIQTVHTNINQYRCMRCGKKYATQEILDAHYVKHNAAQKPFKCQFCSKSFNHKADRKRHELSHAKNKPFQCTFCDKGFIRNDHLAKHLLMHDKRSLRKKLMEATD